MERNSAILVKNNLGFTLVELLTVISIILVLSAFIFPSWRNGEKSFALARSSGKLAQDIRRSQEMAMSAKDPGVYGVRIGKNSANYILFADLNGNLVYNTGEELELMSMEKNITVADIYPDSDFLNIVFSSPDPTTSFTPDSESVFVTITNGSQSKVVLVNKAGLIEAQ